MSGKKIYDWEFGLFERSWGRRGVACPDCVNESNVSIIMDNLKDWTGLLYFSIFLLSSQLF